MSASASYGAIKLRGRLRKVASRTIRFSEFLSPAIYRDRTNHTDQERIAQQIDRLPREIQCSVKDSSNPEGVGKLTFADLLSDFLKHAWRCLLRHIKVRCADLPWPDTQDEAAYCDFDPANHTKMEVTMPVPADSGPQHVELIAQTARLAGIPIDHYVAEPAAAYAFDLQSRTDASGPVDEQLITIVCDIGRGSADVQAYSTAQITPLCVREEVAGLAQWCGGGRVNEHVREIVKARLHPVIEQVLEALRMGGRPMTEHDLLDKIEVQFEAEKRQWRPNEDLSLEVPGLPNIPMIGIRRDRIGLPREAVKEAFDEMVSPVFDMLDTIVRRLNSEGKKADEILILGGSSCSIYFKQKMARRYSMSTADRPEALKIRMADDIRRGTATCIAQGALLMRLDRAFVKQRPIRRSYYVKTDVLCKPKDPMRQLPNVERDPIDGKLRRRNVSYCLLRDGENIPDNYRVRGPDDTWRALSHRDQVDGVWTLEEPLLDADLYHEDGTWVDNAANGFHCCGMIKVQLDETDCAKFERRVSEHDKEFFWYLEYRVEVLISGVQMTFQIVIPRSGKFRRGEPGPDPIRKEAQLDCSGVWGLFNAG